MASFNPFVSIIIPVKNFERTIEKTFEYLLAVDYPRDSWEWVIADGGSTDKTVEIIESWRKIYPFIKLVQIPNCPSPGFARNKALEAVKGDFLFFTDADCAPDKNWINEMLKHFSRDPQIAAVGGEVFTLKVDPNNLVEAWCQHFRFNMVSPRYGFIQEGYYPEFPRDPEPSDIGGHKAYFFGTCNVAYRRSAMREIGAKFWERPTGEDMDLSYQHRQAGWKFYFAPKAKVDHMHRADLKALLRVWVTYGQAHLPLIQKYVRKNNLEIILQFLKGNPSFVLPFPLKGFIYLGNFHMLHIFALLFILGVVGNFIWLGVFWKIFTLASLFLTIYFLYQYVKWNFGMEPKDKFFTWCRMKYLTNLSFIRGGLKGLSKHKVLCIEPSF
ncbi:MAG: glycosyltransferase [Candidatus Omnitrophica bacterium]|nr:glycosyltransferase [Candidatus Omnitrophota bacterium]MDD5592505.1 glycosyltransferase [Candidatus Omnitrophota bacterium]